MREWCKFNFPASQDLTKGNHFVLSQHQANKKEKVCNYECPLPLASRGGQGGRLATKNVEDPTTTLP